ncbi:histidine kinase-, DNA gyrase B-, and HSP90-like ATPase family protein [Burkholderia thailandensis E254]|uniref:ATP-binding protein n=1 Tax=Burkholderia thailandensis TaxID=57975 RepID=UPI000517B1FF|nr:ATP-binding protein [Burkholderia thailandensis]AIT22012.1 histidine kinase-, DNA gyrase B-, and HSP90-like ATPase family protein [Burkholderia thailandensis E254]PNE69299.1 ATP-binding protein [Burkholderia thailandensis]TPQ43988.1 ATP-binding protein [Burkholderia ubonensis]
MTTAISPADDALKLPFRPRARLLQLLGDQLIGTPRLAVFELVKNAYDADAETVTVTLEGLNTSNPIIVVQDDGDGMDLPTIRDIWLVPAHDHRELQRRALKRTRLHRLPLGEKGLGRFAVHKLGDHIELVTRAKGQLECVVRIDWSSLIEKQFLSDAEVSVQTRTPEVFTDSKTGTKLTISKLREVTWTRGEVRRLLRQITSIASPFTNRSDRFETELMVPDHPDWVSGVPDVDVLLQRAPWHFRFSFENGVLEWEYEFRGVTGIKLAPRKMGKESGTLLIAQERDLDIYGTDQGSKSTKPRRVTADASISDGIGTVKGEFYVFDRDREILNKLGDSQLVQNFLDENGGVRVYRDSIRVYNYGEPGDDWLGLDLRRVNTPTRNISRNIVVGAIDLSLEKSQQLTEKTNREGFVENDAYHRLRRIVLGALAVLEVERKIDKDNIRAVTGAGHDPEVANIAQPLQALRDVAKKHHISEELDPLINKAEKNYNEMRDTMLRAGLSGMGLAIVFHEIEQGVRVLHDAIEAGRNLESVQVQARELVRILDGFSELLRKGEQRPNSIKHLIKRVRDINRVRFRNHEVKLVCPALEESVQDIERKFAFGLLLGALNNLLDNAFYWLQVRWPEGQGTSQRKLYINVDPDFAGGPAIIVADNGPGFQDDPDRLTRPFFSRRPDGMGVGLYYTNMVMELNGGRLAFPDADEANVPEGFDGAVLALVFGKGNES